MERYETAGAQLSSYQTTCHEQVFLHDQNEITNSLHSVISVLREELKPYRETVVALRKVAISYFQESFDDRQPEHSPRHIDNRLRLANELWSLSDTIETTQSVEWGIIEYQALQEIKRARAESGRKSVVREPLNHFSRQVYDYEQDEPNTVVLEAKDAAAEAVLNPDFELPVYDAGISKDGSEVFIAVSPARRYTIKIPDAIPPDFNVMEARSRKLYTPAGIKELESLVSGRMLGREQEDRALFALAIFAKSLDIIWRRAQYECGDIPNEKTNYAAQVKKQAQLDGVIGARNGEPVEAVFSNYTEQQLERSNV